MKKYKKIGVYLLAICLIFALTACNDSEADEFTSLRSFEYHFIPKNMRKNIVSMKRRLHLKPIQTINSKWTQLVKVGQ